MSKIFGHRGYSGRYPENTLLAFEKALEVGVDGIEFDVHLTKDGEIVIMHDENIRRTCDGEGLIKDMTFEELRSYNAAASWGDSMPAQKVPTLREYCELVKDAGIISNIELKTSVFEYPGIEKKVIDMVYEYGLQDSVIFSSFNHETVMRCAEIAPEIKRGLLVEDWLIEFGAYAEKLGVQCCHPVLFCLRKDTVDEMHSHGMEINTWIVNEYEDIRRLADLGVDGLIGNYPDRMIELLR